MVEIRVWYGSPFLLAINFIFSRSDSTSRMFMFFDFLFDSDKIFDSLSISSSILSTSRSFPVSRLVRMSLSSSSSIRSRFLVVFCIFIMFGIIYNSTLCLSCNPLLLCVMVLLFLRIFSCYLLQREPNKHIPQKVSS